MPFFKLNRIHTGKISRILTASLLGATACAALPALAAEEETLVFFCPPSIMAAIGQPTNGIMCDSDRCFNSKSPGLTAEQTAFLSNRNGQCRYLNAQEVSSVWPKDLPEETQHATK